MALTASPTSTVVEEFIQLLREFHGVPEWTDRFNAFIMTKLATATDHLSHPTFTFEVTRLGNLREPYVAAHLTRALYSTEQNRRPVKSAVPHYGHFVNARRLGYETETGRRRYRIEPENWYELDFKKLASPIKKYVQRV